MIEIITITLENEMDLVLAHKQSMRLAEKLSLSSATQTTFATAVSEISRAVIEYSDKAILVLGLLQQKTRYSLTGLVRFPSDVHFTNADAGFFYAQKLVPGFELRTGENENLIEMTIGLPRSLKLDPIAIRLMKSFFDLQAPLNAYDEIKKRNSKLNQVTSEQEKELRQSKLVDEKKTEFISVASHELKTPLTVLKAYVQLANKTQEPISTQLRGVLQKIDVQTGKLMNLVQQLLDISKIENGNLEYEPKDISLNDFLLNQLAIMQQILPDYKLVAELDSEVVVAIDVLRMEQVISNLLGNAAKYSAKDTTVLITSRISDEGQVTVGIADQGMGISQADLQSIFDKFYRAQDVINSHYGLGMGLFVTSKIISDHGGKIWAESEVGKGSVFFFTLPTIK